jgi:hypothetical protein
MFHFLSTTGVGLETVDVTYDMDDGIVFDVEIKWQGKEISGLLSEEVNADIEMACYADQRKREALEIVNHNYDCGEKLAWDRQINRTLEAA